MLRTRTYKYTYLTLLVAAALSTGAATHARFHTTLTKSVPANHDTIAVAPKQVRLWFSEKVELKLSSVTMKDAKGVAVKLGALTRRDTANAPVVATVPAALAPSTYTVTWRAPGDDGHPSTGKFEFVLKAPH